MNVADLKKYKSDLYTSLSRDLSDFEKNFLLITSGILAFSITFIKDIVKIQDSFYLWLLFLAWFLISLSIGLMMFTFLFSASASDKLSKCVDDYIKQEQLFDNTANLSDAQATQVKDETDKIAYSSKRILKILRYISISLFTVGIISFSVFVSINLYKENIKENKAIKPKEESCIKLDSLKIYTKDSEIYLKTTHGKK